MFNVFWAVAIIGFIFLLALLAGLLDWFNYNLKEYEDDYEDYKL